MQAEEGLHYGRDTILVTDSNLINRQMLAAMFVDDYRIVEASDSEETIEILKDESERILLVLLDFQDPAPEGTNVLEYMKQEEYLRGIPVILISADQSIDTLQTEYAFGVAEIIHRPFEKKEVIRRVENIINLYTYERELDNIVMNQMAKLFRNFNFLRIKERETNEIMSPLDEMCFLLEDMMNEPHDHVDRICKHSKMLASRLSEMFPKYGLTERKIDMIGRAAAFHDIGKIAIPDTVFWESDRVTPREITHMRKHTRVGSELLKVLEPFADKEFYQICQDVCKFHHERFNGKGYPVGMIGKEIPISAQIVALADAYDCLVYIKEHSGMHAHKAAVRVIMEADRNAFNPDLLDCFEAIEQDFAEEAGM